MQNPLEKASDKDADKSEMDNSEQEDGSDEDEPEEKEEKEPKSEKSEEKSPKVDKKVEKTSKAQKPAQGGESEGAKKADDDRKTEDKMNEVPSPEGNENVQMKADLKNKVAKLHARLAQETKERKQEQECKGELEVRFLITV